MENLREDKGGGGCTVGEISPFFASSNATLKTWFYSSNAKLALRTGKDP